MTLLFRRRKGGLHGTATEVLSDPPRTVDQAYQMLAAGKLMATKESKELLRDLLEPKRRKRRDVDSSRWKRLRYDVLAAAGGKCQCCGRAAKDGITLHVDHIKPVSKHPDLAYERDNLQALCNDCNLGKLNRDDTDFR